VGEEKERVIVCEYDGSVFYAYMKMTQWKTFSLFLLLCLVSYIVAFVEVLIIYQIYHIWVNPLYTSSLYPLTPCMEQYQQTSFFHVCTCVHSISPSYTFSPHPPPPTGRMCTCSLI
jgi:hypothetical protein